MNSEVQQILEQLIAAADGGEWHNSEDCEVEDRAQDCELCRGACTGMRTDRKIP